MIQLNLGNGTAKAYEEQVATAVQTISEEGTAVCQFCGVRGTTDEVEWHNGGGLISGNPKAHEACYLNYLKVKHRLNDTGYRLISNGLVEVFSQTTGWETINPKLLMGVEGDNFLGTNTFPCIVQTLNEQKRFEHCFGITQACADYLRANGEFHKAVEDYNYKNARGQQTIM